MAQTIEIGVEGVKEAQESMDRLSKGIERQIMYGLERAMQDTVDNIKITFKGRPGPGFHDKSGALRSSIRGGIAIQDGDEVGFIGAGDERMGSDAKRTEDYVGFIEFGEFARAGNTSFLRAGVQKNMRNIKNIISESIDLEKLIG